MKKPAIFVLACLVGCSIIGGATRSDKAEVSRNLDIFNSLYKVLQTTYVDTIDAEKSINTAINAMLGELDPYTEYIPEKDQESFMTISTGEYGGIGSYIMERKGKVYVSEPQEGSPALKSGLRAGDLFVKIDGDTVDGWKSDKVSSRLKGPAGTKVKVTVKRPYAADSIIDFEITRAKIKVHPVPYYGVTRDNIGYIFLSTFNEKSADEVRNALTELKKDPKVKSIILDLRNNGGGILEGAVKIAGLFVPKGTEIVRTRGKGLLNEKIYKTTSSPVDTEIPLAVLINGGSASSAEIVAGALQDMDRAVIVGSTSFGKGLVQSSRPLPYNGLLKVTVAKYYIPSGRLIQAIDYSNRKPDGSVARIPDSLTKEFQTLHGRTVRDGGGITPDVKVEYPDATRITYNIVRDNWAFDFATRYAATHDSIPAPEEFVVTDEIYDEFKRFIDPEKFSYDKVCETMLSELEKTAKTEGYMTDEAKAQFDVMRGILKHDLDKDLNTNRKEISSFIASEIVGRYYNQRGQIIESLRTDIDVDSAARVLNDIEAYRKLLNRKK